jgi:hypothetical protein
LFRCEVETVETGAESATRGLDQTAIRAPIKRILVPVVTLLALCRVEDTVSTLRLRCAEAITAIDCQ